LKKIIAFKLKDIFLDRLRKAPVRRFTPMPVIVEIEEK